MWQAFRSFWSKTTTARQNLGGNAAKFRPQVEEFESRLLCSVNPITDFNGDGRADIAFHNPGSTWSTVPVLTSTGNGAWNSTNSPVPSWANESGVVAVTGDFNGDRRTDVAFYKPGSTWNTLPELLAAMAPGPPPSGRRPAGFTRSAWWP